MRHTTKEGESTMRNCIVPIQFSISVKRELDALKLQGYTIAGFVRKAVERELAHHRRAQKGRTPHAD